MNLDLLKKNIYYEFWLLHKREICRYIKLIYILLEVNLFCLKFYYMKNILENRFDNIDVVITKIWREIKLYLREKQKLIIANKAKSAPALLLSSNIGSPASLGKRTLRTNFDKNYFLRFKNDEEEEISNIKNLESQ